MKTPVQLWVCDRGICPPRLESGRCHHGRLEQTTYIPIAVAYQAVDNLYERMRDACDPDEQRRHWIYRLEAA